jgi:hypothetical protein
MKISEKAASPSPSRILPRSAAAFQSAIDFRRFFCYNNKSEEIYCFFGKERLKKCQNLQILLL